MLSHEERSLASLGERAWQTLAVYPSFRFLLPCTNLVPSSSCLPPRRWSIVLQPFSALLSVSLHGRIAVLRSLLIILALASALPASASDIGAVKCAVNQDRVWVYESLNSFDVETRLKCGETVEILSRVKGYVKIRTASGVEGYVPDAVFPDLPALPPDDADKPMASMAARPAATAVAHPTVAAQPAAASRAVASTVAPPAPSIAAAPVVASKPAPPPANSAVVSSNSPVAVNVKPASAVASPATSRSRDKASAPTVVAEPAAPKKAPAKAGNR